jgi:UTP-glucose-1-phosphate uridylyltransferase
MRLLSGLSEVERSEVSKFGVIDGEVVDSGNIRVKGIVEKPRTGRGAFDGGGGWEIYYHA